MKLTLLFEIIDTLHNTKRISKTHPSNIRRAIFKFKVWDNASLKHHNRENPENSRELLGNRASDISGGMFGWGIEDKNDPHLFDKRNYDFGRLHEDPYYEWMLVCKEHASSNPYLPRVYNIDVTLDKYNEASPRYKIEKLTPLSDLDEHSIEAMISKFADFDKFKAKYVNEQSATVTKALEPYFKAVLRGTETPTDKNLKAALSYVGELISKKKHFHFDIHEENVMCRRGPTGFQMVITDPLYAS